MIDYRQQFMEAHYERLFYMSLMFISGLLFIALGLYVITGDAGQQLIGSGITQLIGFGALAGNKARSPKEKSSVTSE